MCVTKRSETKRNVKGRKKYAAVAVDPVVVTERAGRVTGVRTPSLRPRLRVLPCWVARPGGKGDREVEVDDAWGRFRLRGSGARVAVGGGAGRFGADRFCQVLIRWKFEFGRGRDTVMWSVLQAYMVFCYETENGKGNGHCAFLSILSSLKIAIPAYVDIRGNGLRSVITGFHYLSFC